MGLERRFGARLPEVASDRWELLDRFVSLLRSSAIPRGLVGFDDAELEVARSLILSSLIRGNWVDVGTGAGFPGMPLAIAYRPGTLIEPRRRAVGFLERALRELGIKVTLVAGSAQEVAIDRPEGFSTVLTRALAPPSQAIELCAPLVAEGGRLVITASPEGRASLDAVGDSELGKPRLETVDFGLDLVQSVLIIDRPPPPSPQLPPNSRPRGMR